MRPRTFLVVIVALFVASVVIVTVTRRRPVSPNEAKTPPPVVGHEPEPAPASVDVSNPPEVEETGIRLEVVNEKSEPVEGARAHDARKYDAALGVTNGKGILYLDPRRLRVDLEFGHHLVRIEHASYAPEMVRVLRDVESVRVVLKAAAVLTVRVLNKRHEPLPAARVQIYETDRGGEFGTPWNRERMVDSRGEVRIADLHPGPLVLRALAPGHENTRHIVVTRSGEHREVVFTLAAAKILNVTVRDTSGVAVEQAEVTVTHSGGGGGWGTTYGHEMYAWRQTTDKDGKTSFPNIPPRIERVSLHAVGPKLAPTYVAVSMNEAINDFEVVLQPGAALSVEVLNHLGASVDCSLELGDPGGRSSFQSRHKKAAGSPHVFSGVTAGKPVSVSVYLHHSPAHHERDLILGAGETRELTIRLKPGFPLTVRARDLAGRPVEGMLRVTGVRPNRQEYVEEIGPEGQVRLVVEPAQYEITFSPYPGLRPAARTVSIEAETSIDIEVPGTAELRGLLRDSDGSPVANASLEWTEGRQTLKTRTDTSGRFQFPRVSAGGGSLRLITYGSMLETFSGAAPPEPLELVVPLSTVEGIVLGVEGRPASAMVVVRAVRGRGGFMEEAGGGSTATDAEGRFRFRAVPGKWTMVAHGEGATSESDVATVEIISPGTTASAVLQLKTK